MKKIFFITVLSLCAGLVIGQQRINTNVLVVKDSIYFQGTWYTTSLGGLTKQQADLLYVPLQTYPPTAGISGGVTQDLLPSGAVLPYTLSWTAGRQAGSGAYTSTANLTSITVAGVAQTFTNPSPGASVSGTKAVSVTRNVNTSFTNSVVAADGRGAAANTYFNFYPRIYYGFVSSLTPSDADIQGLQSSLQPGGSISGSVGAPSGQKYICFARLASFGAPSIVVNTFAQPSANYNITSRDFTSAAGHVFNAGSEGQYQIIVFKTTTGGGYSFSLN